MGRARILAEPSFQARDTVLEVLELRQVVLHRAQRGLDCRGRLLPVLAWKGQRPRGIVGCRKLIHTVSALCEQGHSQALLIAKKRAAVQRLCWQRASVAPANHSKHV